MEWFYGKRMIQCKPKDCGSTEAFDNLPRVKRELELNRISRRAEHQTLSRRERLRNERIFVVISSGARDLAFKLQKKDFSSSGEKTLRHSLRNKRYSPEKNPRLDHTQLDSAANPSARRKRHETISRNARNCPIPRRVRRRA